MHVTVELVTTHAYYLRATAKFIIESVDSNVGIARTRNIYYKNISPNLRNGKLICVYNNVPSIFECFHDQQDP